MRNRTRHLILVATGALLALAFAAGPASADYEHWEAVLAGAVSDGTGEATITAYLDMEGLVEYMTVYAEFYDLEGPVITDVAFYLGSPSSGGTYIMSLGADNPVDIEILYIPLMQLAMFTQALFSDNLYLNVATDDAKALGYPDGEIEGAFIYIGVVADEALSWGGIKALFR